MSQNIKLCKGLDIKLAGKAEELYRRLLHLLCNFLRDPRISRF